MKVIPAVPDPPEVDHILWADFRPTDVAYDVGANCGQTISRIRGFSSTVVGFEPSEESFAYLTEHFGWRPGYVLSNLAASSRVGVVELVAVRDKIETGQLVTAGTPGMEWSGDLEDGTVRTLECTTLDAYAEATGLWPGFLKIDVEGHELEVLRGATRILTSGPELLIEIHSEQLGEDIKDLLEGDFLIEVVRHPHYPVGSELWLTHHWLRCFPFRN